MVQRTLTESLLQALKYSPVVFLAGPRQAGKSTLAESLSQNEFPADYVTLDNLNQQSAAQGSPYSFLKARQRATVIDEIQQVPDLFRPLKQIVDERRKDRGGTANGQFLLTGSANILALPKLSQALTGRMAVRTLFPFSCVETEGGNGQFLQNLFANTFRSGTEKSERTAEVIARATFPEISGRSQAWQQHWLEGYLTTLIQRDVKALAEIEKLALFPALLTGLASRVATPVNDSDLTRIVQTTSVTIKRYRTFLKWVFLTFELQPWFQNIGKRLVKTPKSFFTDTLLLMNLLHRSLPELEAKDSVLFGHVLENFVATELLKQASFSKQALKLFHFRTSDNHEIDFIIESPKRELVAIEVKSSDQVRNGDFKTIGLLKEKTGSQFLCGVVLYQGNEIIPFGENLWALPINLLWR